MEEFNFVDAIMDFENIFASRGFAIDYYRSRPIFSFCIFIN